MRPLDRWDWLFLAFLIIGPAVEVVAAFYSLHPGR